MGLKTLMCVLGAAAVLSAGVASVSAQVPSLPDVQLPPLPATPSPPPLPATPSTPNVNPQLPGGNFDPSMLAPMLGGIQQMIPGGGIPGFGATPSSPGTARQPEDAQQLQK